MKWNELSMADKAKYIQLGVQNNITSLDDIIETYNSYAEGGNLQEPHYNKKSRRWYNSEGEMIIPGNGYWDNKSKRYIMYGNDGTVTRYSALDWAKKKRDDIVRRRKELEREYSIPVDNRVTITQKGNKETARDRGAMVSKQQVDSILKYADIVGIPPYEALGLSAQESTFSLPDSSRKEGLYYKVNNNNGTWTPEHIDNLSNRVSPVLMTSDWSYINDNPYNDYIVSVEKEKNPEKRNKKALDGRSYLEKQVKKFKIDVPPLQHSLELYKSGRYNPGDKNYNSKVKTRGNYLKNSPEIVDMVNKSKFGKN